MQAAPLTGRAAQVATLRAKLEVATLRAKYGATRTMREEQGTARDRYMRELRALGEEV